MNSVKLYEFLNKKVKRIDNFCFFIYNVFDGIKMNEKNKQTISLQVTDDGYQAYLSVRATPDTMSMTTPDLFSFLNDKGLVYGVKKDVLMLVISRLKQGIEIDNIIIAEGIKAFEGLKPAVNYKFEISAKPKELESGKVDYREVAKILNVKKDQVLAIKRNLQPPVDGIKVTGETIEFEPIEDIKVKTGKNIIVEEQEKYTYYKAGYDGALTFDNQIMKVFPTLEIRQDVDFDVGNIHFTGDVKVGRDVLPDFVVEADGHITIWGSAIACQLKSSGNVKVRSGIVGKNKGVVAAGGVVTATFVENAAISAAGDITIKNGIIGSKVNCDSTVTLEVRRSRVVGSMIKAAKGIIVYNAGSRFDSGMQMITGINPAMEKEYLKFKKILDAKLGEAKELEKRYGRSTLENQNFTQKPSPELVHNLKKWNFLKEQIKKIMNHLKGTEADLYDYSATIRIKETLFPRVSLQIGKFHLMTSKEWFDVTVKYSEEENKLLIS